LASLAAIAYTPYVKHLLFLKNIYIVALSLLPFLYPAVVAHRLSRGFVLTLVVAPGLLAREVVMDMRDIDGDRAVGVLTLPGWLGLGRSRALVCVILVVNTCCAPAVYRWIVPGNLTPVGVRVTMVCFLSSAVTMWLNRKPSRLFLTVIIRVVLGGVVAAIVAVVRAPTISNRWTLECSFFGILVRLKNIRGSRASLAAMSAGS
jgi:4-hydroxybenzoate polyprenyltransferase